MSHEGEQRRGGCSELYHRIAYRDRGFAMTTSSAKQDVAHDRNVVVGENELAARRTARARRDERLPQGKPMDHDVQEAPPDESKKSCESRKQPNRSFELCQRFTAGCTFAAGSETNASSYGVAWPLWSGRRPNAPSRWTRVASPSSRHGR